MASWHWGWGGHAYSQVVSLTLKWVEQLNLSKSFHTNIGHNAQYIKEFQDKIYAHDGLGRQTSFIFASLNNYSNYFFIIYGSYGDGRELSL